MEEGVDFADATNIFDLDVSNALFWIKTQIEFDRFLRWFCDFPKFRPVFSPRRG